MLQPAKLEGKKPDLWLSKAIPKAGKIPDEVKTLLKLTNCHAIAHTFCGEDWWEIKAPKKYARLEAKFLTTVENWSELIGVLIDYEHSLNGESDGEVKAKSEV